MRKNMKKTEKGLSKFTRWNIILILLKWVSAKTGSADAMIRISVIVPVYNVEKYLPQCLDSLAAQTLPEMEFILVNDGCTDGSGTILREYAARHDRFRLVEQENRGCAGARNAAFPLARGEYIGFVDSDDWVRPDMFRRLWELAASNDADVAECSFTYYYERDGIYVQNDITALAALLKKSGGTIRGAEGILFDTPASWNRIYRREMLERYNLRFVEQMRTGEDICLALGSLSVARRIVATPESFYFYRFQRPGQQTSFGDERLFSFFTLFDFYGDFIRKHNLEYLEPWILHLRLSRYCYGYENVVPALREAYFAAMKEQLLAAGISAGSRIARGSIAYGGARNRIRYALLAVLHPICLRAVMAGNRKQFELIISLRLFLLDLPRRIMKSATFFRRKSAGKGVLPLAGTAPGN